MPSETDTAGPSDGVYDVARINAALNEAAADVRRELLRLDYVEGDVEPDGEDKAIACAAVKAFLIAFGSDALARQIPGPETYSGW